MSRTFNRIVRLVVIGLFVTTIGTRTATSEETGSPQSSATQQSPAELFEAVLADWEAARQKSVKAVESAKTEAETNDAWKLVPDRLVYSQRMLSIAESNADAAASRDALLWIINQRGVLPAYHGALADLEQQAVELLLEHHADDPKLARVAANLNNIPSPARDALMDGLMERAENRETQGLSRIALALYLMKKTDVAQAQQALAAKKNEGGDNRDPHLTAYLRSLASCDVAAIRSRIELVLEESVAKYADVPVYSETASTGPRRKQTVGQFAGSLLDEIRNLAIGKPAPQIDGMDLDGVPLKLSDYRGKIVVLVFWGSWCGPCVAEMPHERELVERLRGRPFALLGIDCDEDPESGRRVVEMEKVNWRNWNEPMTQDSEGPLVERFHVRQFPSTFVLDAQGIIRAKNLRGEGLDKTVETLLLEFEAGGSQ